MRLTDPRIIDRRRAGRWLTGLLVGGLAAMVGLGDATARRRSIDCPGGEGRERCLRRERRRIRRMRRKQRRYNRRHPNRGVKYT